MKARIPSSESRLTRTATTLERTVGSKAPGSLDVRIRFVSAGGSSRSFKNAFAAASAPSCGTIRSASPMTKTFRLAIAGDIAASRTIARTVAT